MTRARLASRIVTGVALLLGIGATTLRAPPSVADDGPAPPVAPAPAPVAAPATPATPPAPAPEPAPAATPAPPRPAPTEEEAAATAFARSVESSVWQALASVRDSSVTIFNLQPIRPDGAPVRVSGGSGVVVAWKGKGPYVVTNEHVVKDAVRLEIVSSDGKVTEARLRDHVTAYDIALLEFVGSKPASVKTAKFGRSEDLVEGRWVFATGNPYFLAGDGEAVATLGVVSGLERFLRGSSTYADAIQHDAEVNPGNSGGPLWTLAGELVGINGMISSRRDGAGAGAANTGAAFAIPIHLVQRYFDALISDKVSAVAGTLGLVLEDAKGPDGRPIGARVRAFEPKCPCQRRSTEPKDMGLAVGDVVVRLGLGPSSFAKWTDVFTAQDVVNALAPYPQGATASVLYLRDGKRRTWKGTLAGSS